MSDKTCIPLDLLFSGKRGKPAKQLGLAPSLPQLLPPSSCQIQVRRVLRYKSEDCYAKTERFAVHCYQQCPGDGMNASRSTASGSGMRNNVAQNRTWHRNSDETPLSPLFYFGGGLGSASSAKYTTQVMPERTVNIVRLLTPNKYQNI